MLIAVLDPHEGSSYRNAARTTQRSAADSTFFWIVGNVTWTTMGPAHLCPFAAGPELSALYATRW